MKNHFSVFLFNAIYDRITRQHTGRQRSAAPENRREYFHIKKFFAITLVLSLVLALPAFAEQSIEAVQMNWSEDAEKAFVDAGFEGYWFTLTLDNVECKAIIPTGYVLRDATEEEKAEGVALLFENETNGGAIVVLDTQLDYENLVEIGSQIKEETPDRLVQYAMINGTGALITGDEETDRMNAVFALGDHRYIQYIFSPVTGNNDLLALLLASIQF